MEVYDRTRRGCKITFCGSVILCNRYRTFDKNCQTAKEALVLILGYDPLEDGTFNLLNGMVEAYSES